MSSTSTTTSDTHDADDLPDTDQGTRTTTAGDRLWAALHARPGGTAEQLATDAGIGRSTAAKILAHWVDDATVERVRVPRGEKKSGASRYAITAPTDAAGLDDTTNPSLVPRGLTDGADRAVSDGPTPGHVGPADATAEAVGPSDPEDPATTAAPRDPDAPELDPTEPGPVADSSTSENTPEPRPADAPEVDLNGTGPAAAGSRLRPGALHGMVEDYLREHAGEALGPTKIGHDLGRSSGAVSNALERLVAAGYAVRTKDQPKRYALAATEANEPEAGEQPG